LEVKDGHQQMVLVGRVLSREEDGVAVDQANDALAMMLGEVD
jgi:hypothetical protein